MQPMPTVARARIYLPDAQAALDRARDAWNPTQLRDALRSLRTFVERAEEMLSTDQRTESKGRRMMRTSELTGALLDYWVARAEGFSDAKIVGEQGNPNDEFCLINRRPYMPSTDWAQGGPVIEREEISLLPGPWSAQVFLEDGLRSFEGIGLTPLIAAMRAYVASKFGDEVPDLAEGGV